MPNFSTSGRETLPVRVRIKSDFSGAFIGRTGSLIRVASEGENAQMNNLTHLVQLDPAKGESQSPTWWAPYELEMLGANTRAKEGAQNG